MSDGSASSPAGGSSPARQVGHHRHMGWRAVEKAQYTEAELHFRKALELSTATYGWGSEDVMKCHSHLGDLFVATRTFETSLQHYERALTIAEQLHAEEQTATTRKYYASTRNDLAFCHYAAGESHLKMSPQRMGAYRRSLEHYTAVLTLVEGPERYEVLANQGSLLMNMGRFQDSKAALQRALDVYDAAAAPPEGPKREEVVRQYRSAGRRYQRFRIRHAVAVIQFAFRRYQKYNDASAEPARRALQRVGRGFLKRRAVCWMVFKTAFAEFMNRPVDQELTTMQSFSDSPRDGDGGSAMARASLHAIEAPPLVTIPGDRGGGKHRIALRVLAALRPRSAAAGAGGARSLLDVLADLYEISVIGSGRPSSGSALVASAVSVTLPREAPPTPPQLASVTATPIAHPRAATPPPEPLYAAEAGVIVNPAPPPPPALTSAAATPLVQPVACGRIELEERASTPIVQPAAPKPPAMRRGSAASGGTRGGTSRRRSSLGVLAAAVQEKQLQRHASAAVEPGAPLELLADVYSEGRGSGSGGDASNCTSGPDADPFAAASEQPRPQRQVRLDEPTSQRGSIVEICPGARPRQSSLHVVAASAEERSGGLGGAHLKYIAGALGAATSTAPPSGSSRADREPTAIGSVVLCGVEAPSIALPAAPRERSASDSLSHASCGAATADHRVMLQTPVTDGFSFSVSGARPHHTPPCDDAPSPLLDGMVSSPAQTDAGMHMSAPSPLPPRERPPTRERELEARIHELEAALAEATAGKGDDARATPPGQGGANSGRGWSTDSNPSGCGARASTVPCETHATHPALQERSESLVLHATKPSPPAPAPPLVARRVSVGTPVAQPPAPPLLSAQAARPLVLHATAAPVLTARRVSVESPAVQVCENVAQTDAVEASPTDRDTLGLDDLPVMEYVAVDDARGEVNGKENGAPAARMQHPPAFGNGMVLYDTERVEDFESRVSRFLQFTRRYPSTSRGTGSTSQSPSPHSGFNSMLCTPSPPLARRSCPADMPHSSPAARRPSPHGGVNGVATTAVAHKGMTAGGVRHPTPPVRPTAYNAWGTPVTNRHASVP